MSETSEDSKEHSWSRKKRDQLPRGLFVHPASSPKATSYAIRYVCGAGHVHPEKAGPLKSEAIRRYHERRDESGWCPAVERREARERASADQQREDRRMTFRQYAEDYLL
jgi:hypothetical protein